MALEYRFPDVYDWICHLHHTLKDVGNTASLELTSMDGKMISVHAHSNGYGVVFLVLWSDSVCLGELGACSIENAGSEEAMDENLFPLFSKLCVYAFFRVTHQDIANLELPPIGYNVLRVGLKKFKKHILPSSRPWWAEQKEEVEYYYMLLDEEGDPLKITSKDTEELQRLDMVSGTVESEIFKQAFNSIFVAASYSHLLHHAKTQLSTGVILQLQKFAKQTEKETLVIIGPDATHRLMKSLAAKFTEIQLRYGTESIDPFEISYSTRLDRYWTVNAYCPRLSMQLQLPSTQDKKKDADLEVALSHQLMHCLIHIRHEVAVFTDWIDVEFQIDNLRCQAFPLKPNKLFPSNLEKEWYFPAKIALTLRPEYKSGVHALSLGASSQNPEVVVTAERSYEATLKAEQGIGTKVKPTVAAEVKVGRKKAYSHSLNNWGFDMSAVNNIEGRLQWTLYDNSYGIPVFNYTPPQFNVLKGKTWSRGDYYKAFRAFAQGGGSVRPFTPEGGVVFAGDMYGTPITWRFHRGSSEGRTVNWIVEGEIWFAYYPNKYRTYRHMEIRSHKFREQVPLLLRQSQLQPHGFPGPSM